MVTLASKIRCQILILASLAFLTACQPKTKVEYAEIASGRIVAIKKDGFMLSGDKHVAFISIDAEDERILKRLKKGEEVTIYGIEEIPGDRTAKITEIVFADGTHIPL